MKPLSDDEMQEVLAKGTFVGKPIGFAHPLPDEPNVYKETVCAFVNGVWSVVKQAELYQRYGLAQAMLSCAKTMCACCEESSGFRLTDIDLSQPFGASEADQRLLATVQTLVDLATVLDEVQR